MARVTISRRPETAALASKLQIFIDGNEVASVGAMRAVTVQIHAGAHTILITGVGAESPKIEFKVSEDQDIRFKCRVPWAALKQELSGAAPRLLLERVS